MERELKKGIYRHFKSANKLYEVIGEAKSADDVSDLVIYKALYEGDFPYGQIWVRRKEDFLSEVPQNCINPNNQKYRFEYISDKVD